MTEKRSNPNQFNELYHKSITRIKYPDEKQNGGQISARRCCSHNDTINPRP